MSSGFRPISSAAQHRHDEEQSAHEGKRQEDDPHVGERQGQRVGRRAQPAHQVTRQGESGEAHEQRQPEEEDRRGADHALRLDDILGADALRDHDGRGHGEAEQNPEQQEHHDVRVTRRGERRLAEKLAHPDRIHRSVDGLEQVAHQYRQGKQQQGARNRAFGKR
jgi:hypothetical protein